MSNSSPLSKYVPPGVYSRTEIDRTPTPSNADVERFPAIIVEAEKTIDTSVDMVRGGTSSGAAFLGGPSAVSTGRFLVGDAFTVDTEDKTTYVMSYKPIVDGNGYPTTDATQVKVYADGQDIGAISVNPVTGEVVIPFPQEIGVKLDFRYNFSIRDTLETVFNPTISSDRKIITLSKEPVDGTNTGAGLSVKAGETIPVVSTIVNGTVIPEVPALAVYVEGTAVEVESILPESGKVVLKNAILPGLNYQVKFFVNDNRDTMDVIPAESVTSVNKVLLRGKKLLSEGVDYVVSGREIHWGDTTIIDDLTPEFTPVDGGKAIGSASANKTVSQVSLANVITVAAGQVRDYVKVSELNSVVGGKLSKSDGGQSLDVNDYGLQLFVRDASGTLSTALTNMYFDTVSGEKVVKFNTGTTGIGDPTALTDRTLVATFSVSKFETANYEIEVGYDLMSSSKKRYFTIKDTVSGNKFMPLGAKSITTIGGDLALAVKQAFGEAGASWPSSNAIDNTAVGTADTVDDILQSLGGGESPSYAEFGSEFIAYPVRTSGVDTTLQGFLITVGKDSSGNNYAKIQVVSLDNTNTFILSAAEDLPVGKSFVKSGYFFPGIQSISYPSAVGTSNLIALDLKKSGKFDLAAAGSQITTIPGIRLSIDAASVYEPSKARIKTYALTGDKDTLGANDAYYGAKYKIEFTIDRKDWAPQFVDASTRIDVFGPVSVGNRAALALDVLYSAGYQGRVLVAPLEAPVGSDKATRAQFQAALKRLEDPVDMTGARPMILAAITTDTAIATAVARFCETQSQIENKGECRGFFGFGVKVKFDEAASVANSIFSNMLTVVYPGGTYYPVNGTNVLVEGDMISAYFAGYSAARKEGDFAEPYTNKTLAAFTGLTKILGSEEIAYLATNGVTVLSIDGSKPRIVQGLNTDITNVLTMEPQITDCYLYVQKYVRTALKDYFGKRYTPQYAEAVNKAFKRAMGNLVTAGVISATRGLAAYRSKVDLTTMEVTGEYSVDLPVNWVVITLSLKDTI